MKKLARILALAALAAPFATPAADVGAPVMWEDHMNKVHWELIYEDVSRDLDSDGGPLAVEDSLEANALYVRFHTDVGENALMDFDVGGLDISGADLVPYVGLGLRFLAYDQPAWRIGAHLQVHYAPGIEVDRPALGPRIASSAAEYDLLEVDGGVTFAGKIRIDEQLTLMPYLGPAFSTLSLDGDVTSAGATADVDAGEDSAFGIVGGLALILPGGNTLRVEARAFDDIAVSAAAGILF